MVLEIEVLKPGTLHVITGGMKAKKTMRFLSPFIDLEQTTIRAQLLKPHCDFRKELHDQFNLGREYIVSRDGFHLPATPVDDTNPEDFVNKLDPYAQIYGVSEIQLFEGSNVIVKTILGLLNDGKSVVVEGLDKNFRGEPYHPLPELMAYATSVQKFYGRCDLKECNEKGEYPQRIIDGVPADYNSPVKLVGASEAYEIRCLKHHQVPNKPK